MYYELSKSQKKIARIVMDKGLDKHYERAITDVEEICRKWRIGNFDDNREAYMKLYQCIVKNDENIDRIYNDKGGSRWIEIMSMQLADGVITIDDLRDFDAKVRDTIIQ